MDIDDKGADPEEEVIVEDFNGWTEFRKSKRKKNTKELKEYYECEQCKLNVTKLEELNAHIQTHNPNVNLEEYKCGKCEKLMET